MKVGVIGAGQVGATAAYAMVMRGIGREIVLVDLNQDRARAEADDISHAVPFAHPLNVHSGAFEDLENCQVVVITAGVAQKQGESRLQLMQHNASIYDDLVPDILRFTPNAILLVATNPVDVMTHLTAQIASRYGVPNNQVIGSGTTLDTARFRTLLGKHLGVDPQHVHGYVLGEHGDSEVLSWSLVTVGGVPLDEFCRQWDICTDEAVKREITQQVRQAADTIIQGKGATNYGIGSALARIVEVILRDQRSLLTVCTPVEHVAGVTDITISLPHLVGGAGILDTIQLPLALDEQEEVALRNSAQVVKTAYSELMQRK
jgi:L-lactate dehydrogenase